MDNNELIQRIEALEKWKQERTLQQITYPFDFQSRQILNKYFMRITDVIQYEIVGAASHTVTEYLGEQGTEGVSGVVNAIQFTIAPATIFPYIVDVASDVLTVSGGSFLENQAVTLNNQATGTFPAPFVINTTYYVKTATTPQTFKLSATPGGAAINITSVGTGQHFISYVLS